VSDLNRYQPLGAKALLDILVAMGKIKAEASPPDGDVFKLLVRIEAIPGARDIDFSDPRLDRMLRGLDYRSESVGALIDRLRQPGAMIANRRALKSKLAELHPVLEQYRRQALEEELTEVFTSHLESRDREIIIRYLGWDGHEGRTLEEVGQQYGLTRERVRQISHRGLSLVYNAHVFAPVLERVLEVVVASVPISAETLRATLVEQGLSHLGLGPRAIAQAAELLNRPVEFQVLKVGSNELALLPRHVPLIPAITKAARSLVHGYGLASVAQLRARLAKTLPRQRVPMRLMIATLEVFEGFRWLDEQQTWFQFETGLDYGLPSLISKVLATVPTIGLADLHVAVGRYRRLRDRVPPVDVLKAYCHTLPWARVEGDTLHRQPGTDLSQALSEVEQVLVDVLREHGPRLPRAEFMDLVADRDVNSHSFDAVSTGSPAVAQLGDGLYGLPGDRRSRRTGRSKRVAKRKGPSQRLG